MEKLTHSRMACAKTCLRKHYFQYELCMRKDRDGEALWVGILVHEGLEYFSLGKKAIEEEKEFDFSIIIPKPALPSWCVDEESINDFEIIYAKACGMVEAYLEYWKEDACEDLASEKFFEMPIVNPETDGKTWKWVGAGKIDKIVKLPDGRTAILEHKTTTDDITLDSDYWKRLRMDQQISMYWLGAVSLGYEIKTILYDVIRRPTIRPKQIPLLDENGDKVVKDENGDRIFKKDGKPRASNDPKKGWKLETRKETPAEFQIRMKETMLEEPENYFCRREIPRLKSDLDEFRTELWDQQKLLTACQNHGYWYRNTAVCLHPWRCEYLDICQGYVNIEEGIPEGFKKTEKHPELIADK